MKVDNWYNGQTLEFEMLHGAANVEHNPNSFYVRVILVDPISKIRSYQKLVVVHFDDDDRLE
jgi:hypothetical protein